MTTNRSMIQKSLIPGVHEFVGLSYGATPEEHKPLYEILNSGRSFEEEVYVSGMGGAEVKAEGAAVMYDDIREAYTARWQHETVAIGFAVTKEAFDDDQYDTIARAKAQELGRSMADTKQVKAAAVFNRGFNAGFVGGDGVPLFSDAHPTSVGTFDNRIANDLSESVLEDIAIMASKMTNDRGILIGARAKSLHIPVELQFVAKRILGSDLSVTPMLNVAGNENVSNLNSLNALKAFGTYNGGVFINHRFTDPDAFFVKTTVGNGTKMFVREALSGSQDTDFNTDNMLFKFRERYSFGWMDPRAWIGSTGS